MRTLRKVLDIGLPIAGVVVILSAVLFIRELSGQIVVVVLGILMIEVGIWKLAHQMLPSERMYHALRFEGDQFLGLIPRLNAAVLAANQSDTPENRQQVEEVRDAMHQTVERMVEVAGKTG